MLEALSGLFSSPSSSSTASLQTSYHGRLVRQLEIQINSLIETSKVVGCVETRLKLCNIRLNHEASTQNELLQHDITSMQDQLQLLSEANVQEGVDSSEGFFEASIQSLQHLKQILEERNVSNVVPQMDPRPFEEPGLMKRLGRLQGILQLNQVASIPPESIETMILKLIKRIVSRQFELLHEVFSLHTESHRLVEELCDRQLEIAKKHFEIWKAYIKCTNGLIQVKEPSTGERISPNLKITEAFAMRIQLLCIRLVQRMMAVATENSVDIANLFITVDRSGEERILALLKGFTEGIPVEERLIHRSPHLGTLFIELAKLILEENYRLETILLNNQIEKTNPLSEICKKFEEVYKEYFEQLFLAFAIEDPENRSVKISFLEKEYKGVRIRFNKICEAISEVLKMRSLLEYSPRRFSTKFHAEVEEILGFRETPIEQEGDERATFATRLMTLFRQYAPVEDELISPSLPSIPAPSMPPHLIQSEALDGTPTTESAAPEASTSAGQSESFEGSATATSSSRWDE